MMSLKNRIKQVYGFSLLELVVVLAVTASMSVAILPSFVKHAEREVADKHVDTVLTMHHALRTYYDAQLNDGDPTNNANLFPDGTNDCQELVSSGILPTIPANAWGGAFSCSMQSFDPIHHAAQLEVTNVPAEVTHYLKAQIPLTACTGSTCVSTILPPNADQIVVPGCMIPQATNYNPNANADDGSCGCYGVSMRMCTDPNHPLLGFSSPDDCNRIDGVVAFPSDVGKVLDLSFIYPGNPYWKVVSVEFKPFVGYGYSNAPLIEASETAASTCLVTQ